MIQQKQQEGLTRLSRESVNVIQDQDSIVLEDTLKVVKEASQHLFVLGRMPGALSLSRDIQACIDARQSCSERGKEAHRVVLSLFTGKPGHWSRGCSGPFGQQGCFARASRSRDHYHWPKPSLLQERKQARTRHMLHGQERWSDTALENHGR